MKHLAISLILLALVGCTHLYKMYEYEEISLVSEFGFLNVSAIGNWNKVSENPAITEKAAPYYIRILFETDEEPGKEVELRIIDVAPSSSPVSFYKANEPGITERSLPHTAGSRESYYSVLVEGLYPAYEPIHVKFQLRYGGEVEDYDVLLKPMYWEEYRNDIWSAFMGI